jgi:integrase/recombinase XerD
MLFKIQLERLRDALYQPASALTIRSGGGIGVSISRAIEELLISKTSGNRRPVYLKSLRHYLERFSRGREGFVITDFSSSEIELWLSKFGAAYSRQTWLNRISTLFSFAVRRGYLDKNPCDRIERVTVDKKPPLILSPDVAAKLVNLTPASCLAGVALGLFMGVRPDEINRLTWGDICFSTKTVRVDGKTRRRRIVAMHPKMRLLLGRARLSLDAIPKPSDKVAPSLSTVRRFKRAAARALGFKTWPPDLLRHTAASYLLGLHNDAGKVAMMLGNSSAVLLTHYHQPVTADAAERFWKV